MPICLSVDMYMLVQAPAEARSLDPPKAGFTGIWSEFWELNAGPLQEKYILLITQPSLHSLPTVFDVRKKIKLRI